MIKMAVYVDGPIQGRTDVIKFAFLYDTNKMTPTDISENDVVRYKFYSLALNTLIASGKVINPIVFLNNINKFTYTAGGGLVFSGGNLNDNMRIAELDETAPLSCLRANTVINFGRL